MILFQCPKYHLETKYSHNSFYTRCQVVSKTSYKYRASLILKALLHFIYVNRKSSNRLHLASKTHSRSQFIYTTCNITNPRFAKIPHTNQKRVSTRTRKLSKGYFASTNHQIFSKHWKNTSKNSNISYVVRYQRVYILHGMEDEETEDDREIWG